MRFTLLLVYLLSFSAYADDHYNDYDYDYSSDPDNPARGCYTERCNRYSEYQNPYSEYQNPYSEYQNPYSEYQNPYSDKYIPNCKYTGAC